MEPELFWAAIGILTVSLLYSSVGHGGATGYIAMMTLLNFPQREVSSAALIMNVIVSLIALIQFARVGEFKRKIVAPFLIASVPAAFWGGSMRLEDAIVHRIIGVVLGVAAMMLVLPRPKADSHPIRDVSLASSLSIGAVLGAISGMIGIGGGIFLSPLLVLARWATVRQAAAAAACFILANSLSGLGARAMEGTLAPGSGWVLIPIAFIGGVLGSHFGAHKLKPFRMRQVLAIVLLIAAIKNFLTGS